MNRRQLLASAGLPVGYVVLAALPGCQSEEALACVDADNLTMAEESFRRSVNYVARSQIPDQTCSGCAFYSVGEADRPCGTCQMFDQGPVHSAGRCNSWSAA